MIQKGVNPIDRRKFIKDLGVGASAVGVGIGLSSGLIGCGKKEKEEIQRLKKQIEACQKTREPIKPKMYQWRMVTTWPSNFPILGESAERLAQWVREMSDGRLNITVHGGGELCPPLGVFDAVSKGEVEMGHGTAAYWADRIPASHFFAAIPFGLNAQAMNAWILSGGGLALWEELYAPFNVKPFLVGNTGAQAGGWFNREIKTINDYKSLRMRITGLGARVIAKAGAKVVTVAGGDIYNQLESGVIDATEWVGPFHDLEMGFNRVAKYYYWPGWHKPSAAIEMIVGKKAWDTLPKDLQAIVETAAHRSNAWMLSQFTAKNSAALQALTDIYQVAATSFPAPVLKQLNQYATEVIEEMSAADPMTKKVYDAFTMFQKTVVQWDKITQAPCQEQQIPTPKK